MIKNIKWLAIAALVIASCAKEDEVTVANPDSSDGLPLTAGSANFSKYVALGNSLTAGYSDGTLFKEGQKGSWTNLLAEKMKLVGGGEFKIPFTPDNDGGLVFGGTPIQGKRLYLTSNPAVPCLGSYPTALAGLPTTEVTTRVVGPFNNMGVPGAKSFHLLAAGYGNPAGVLTGLANPFYARFATSNTSTILADAMVQAPTFFSLWIGNNDVLGYALSGGTGTNQLGNLNPATYGGNDITDPNVFANVYNTLVNTLTSGPTPAKGVVSNIPYVNTIPQFTTVPYNPLTAVSLGGGACSPTAAADGLANINALNSGLYGPLNAALTSAGAASRISLLSTTGANPLLIKDEYLVNLSTQITTFLAAAPYNFPLPTAGAFGAIYGQARQATSMDYILLTSRAEIGAPQPGVPATINKKGVSFPFEDKLVLSAAEVLELKVATDAFNASILSIATAKGLAFVNANAILSQVNTTAGIISNGVAIKSNYASGGAFSLDGVHPGPRGYALIANKVIEAINAKYGSNMGAYDLSMFRILYPGVL